MARCFSVFAANPAIIKDDITPKIFQESHEEEIGASYVLGIVNTSSVPQILVHRRCHFCKKL